MSVLNLYRCTAKKTDLDGNASDILNLRSEEKRNDLKQSCTPQELWKEHGIVIGVTVSLKEVPSNEMPCIVLINSVKPFTAAFPRADVHELVAPDILHQVIKGGFKDHLVAWVEKYLKLKLGESKANKVMDELDRR